MRFFVFFFNRKHWQVLSALMNKLLPSHQPAESVRYSFAQEEEMRKKAFYCNTSWMLHPGWLVQRIGSSFKAAGAGKVTAHILQGNS